MEDNNIYFTPGCEKHLCRCGKAGCGKVDPINHPTHYNTGKFETIDIIEDWCLGFHLGNVVKYIARAKHKGNYLDDLKKARWYLDRLISFEERKQCQSTKS